MTGTLAAGATPALCDKLEYVALGALLGFVAALQVSIAVAQILLAVALVAWIAGVVAGHETIDVPGMFWPLLAYAAVTLVSSAFSSDPRTSFTDSKQLVLFLIVPAVYRLARGSRATTLVSVIVTVGAVSAALGVIQYGILQYDHLGKRPQGALSHYMTYSGLLTLVVSAAVARILFHGRDRTWSALVLPALLVALALTFTRSAWVGASVATALLLMLKDLRLAAVLPVVVAILFAVAPPPVHTRLTSMFDLKDPTNRDRIAMLRAGARMVKDHPLAGVGPDMVKNVYAEYRDASAVEPNNPHLHNVPVQIAAERGLPALAIWIWFIATVTIDLARRFRTTGYPALAATGLAAVASMLTAGLFEYNFGDSEFLMLFLVLITLPFAADRERRVSS